MKLTILICLFILPLISSAELLELQDEMLSQYRGQAAVTQNAEPPESQAQATNSASALIIQNPSVNTLPSAGITMDINLQLQIDEIRWVDSDGLGSNGSQGAIILKGFSAGHIENGVLSPASIRGITLDVDGNKGVVIGVQQIGDQFGNGIDINIDSVQIN
ncbi:MAG: hypothetical protein V7785_03280 [Bermanella sp.]